MKYLFILENALVEELLQFLVAIVDAKLFKTNKQNLLSGFKVTFFCFNAIFCRIPVSCSNHTGLTKSLPN
jgi:hypothetical protein